MARGKAPAWSWTRFLGLLLFDLWAAHAVAFFAHEYAHSLVAWLLRVKSNPLLLHYAHPSLTVLLVQFGIDQNVDYVALFAAHRGVKAALISGAGPVLGNGVITLWLSRWLYHHARLTGARGWGMFAYWLTVASVGNLIDYVPTRTFTDGTDLYQDMFAVEKGLGWSPWVLLIVLGIPTAIVLASFFLRIEPEAIGWLSETSRARRTMLAVLTAMVLFCFYGAAGLAGGGPISRRMSMISVFVIAPIMVCLGARWAGRSGREEAPTPAKRWA